jgi:hypothetical protein
MANLNLIPIKNINRKSGIQLENWKGTDLTDLNIFVQTVNADTTDEELTDFLRTLTLNLANKNLDKKEIRKIIRTAIYDEGFDKPRTEQNPSYEFWVNLYINQAHSTLKFLNN